MKKANKLQCLSLCENYSKLSNDPHKKVGALLISRKVNEFSIISEGYNCLPDYHEKRFISYKDENDKTKPEVIHAEAKAISSLFSENNQFNKMNGYHYELFCTLSPCMECAKLIHLAGIKKLYYKEKYKDKKPLEFLKTLGVKCEQIK